MRRLEDKGVATIKRVLDASAPRPDPEADQDIKNKYAIRFADEMAKVIAEELQPRFREIKATTKRDAASARGRKQLDINFSTPRLGLAVGISLKSVHIREPKGAKRYTHNKKRNEEELRIEATGYHKRQPFAVMIGVLWLPFDSCNDGKKSNASSFGSWVRHLRPYTGRTGPKDDEDRFERIYVGLYEPDGTNVRFFDIEGDPPKNGRPRVKGPLKGPDGRIQRLLTYREFLDAIYHEYLHRNHADFRWADGDEEPLNTSEIQSLPEDDE